MARPHELIIRVVQPQKIAQPSWCLRGNPNNSDLLLKLIVNNQEELSVLIDSFAKHSLPLHNYASKISQCPVEWQEGVWRRKLTLVLTSRQSSASLPSPPPPAAVPKWAAPSALPTNDDTQQLIKIAETQVNQNLMALPDFRVRVGKNQTKIFNYLRSSLAYPNLTMNQAMVIAEHLANKM